MYGEDGGGGVAAQRFVIIPHYDSFCSDWLVLVMSNEQEPFINTEFCQHNFHLL